MMNIMSLKEEIKLGALAFIYVICLSTLFTSSSFSLGPQGIPRLEAQPERICHTVVEEASRCLIEQMNVRKKNESQQKQTKKNSFSKDEQRTLEQTSQNDNSLNLLRSGRNNNEMNDDCRSLILKKEKCFSTVQAAYSHINLGGCIKELQASAICQEEYCESRRRMTKECQKECHTTLEDLEHCTKKEVKTFLNRAGIQIEGR